MGSVLFLFKAGLTLVSTFTNIVSQLTLLAESTVLKSTETKHVIKSIDTKLVTEIHTICDTLTVQPSLWSSSGTVYVLL